MIDLHTHSLFSDGTDSPEALALAAQEAGLAALALTDHDTLEGLDRFLAMQPRVDTRLVPGIELSCTFLGRPLHVLGLFVDHRNPDLVREVVRLRRLRLERNRAMVGQLQAAGVPITWEEVVALAPTDQVSRTHFAAALVRRGAAGSPQDAFKRYIGDGSPCFVPFPYLAPGTAAGWIRAAGGVAAVAHPGRSFPRTFHWDQAMADLRDQGLQGLEAYYPDYGPLEQATFVRLARSLDMVPCGGSDYHGAHKPGVALGVGSGGLEVPDQALEQLLARRG